MGGDDDKIIRIPGETLTIKVSPEEKAYRKKYLPDAKKLSDEKLVCTVCSVSLAQNIHKGKDIYIHRALQVLVCEACYNFYGDGSFSVDEDGDDKYCRWCGQGGTLFLCSACNCAFCHKCTKQNLKASVLAELENDDWKCYICNPRPLFGCRTICWGAQQLNTIGKEKEQERLKKIKERLEKLKAKKKEESEKRKSRKYSSSEDETSTKKRRRSSDGDDSSPEVMPKRKKRESRVKSASKNLNGSIGRRRKDSSSDAESKEYKKTSRRSRSTKEKSVQSSSDDESDSKSKKDKLKKKKKKKDDSDDSSDSGKKKSKRRLTKKKDSSDEDSSEEEKSRKKKKHPVKKRADSSDDSSDEKKKKKPKKKKNHSSSEESPSETKKKNKNISKKKAESSDKSSEKEDSAKSPKKSKKKLDKEETSKKQDNLEFDNEPKKVKKAATDLEDVNTNSAEDVIVKKRIKLAILWLTTIVKDISELGMLISVRATNFSKKKINTENLKSYEDVINCVGKIKQLIIGVHSNYDHIEKTLESYLKPWKILTGLKNGENEKTGAGESTMAVDGDVSKADNTLTVQAQSQEINGTLEEGKASEKSEENHNNRSGDSDNQNETRAQISKINESLDKSQIEDKQSETGKESAEEKSSEKSFEIVSEEESSKSTKKDSEKPDGSDSKPQKPKKNVSKNNTDAVSDSENGERSPRTSSPARNNLNDEKSKAKEEAGAAEEMESNSNNEKSKAEEEVGAAEEMESNSNDEKSKAEEAGAAEEMESNLNDEKSKAEEEAGAAEEMESNLNDEKSKAEEEAGAAEEMESNLNDEKSKAEEEAGAAEEMESEAVRADRMRGGRNKFGPMYKRDRALMLQMMRQRRIAIQSVDDREWQNSLYGLLQNQTYNQCEVDLFELMCKVLDQHIFSQVDWARNSHFFKNLKVDDQMKLLQHSWSDMLVLDHMHQRMHNSLPDETTLPNGQKFDLLSLGLLGDPSLASHFEEITRHLQELKFDLSDYICVKFLLLLNPDVGGLMNRKHVQESHKQVQHALLEYCVQCYPQVTDKFQKLLTLMPEIHSLASRGEEFLYHKHYNGSAPTQTLLMEMLHAKRK